jgi:hypothetical protein
MINNFENGIRDYLYYFWYENATIPPFHQSHARKVGTFLSKCQKTEVDRPVGNFTASGQ